MINIIYTETILGQVVYVFFTLHIFTFLNNSYLISVERFVVDFGMKDRFIKKGIIPNDDDRLLTF